MPTPPAQATAEGHVEKGDALQALLDVQAVSRLLGCSARHVVRLSNTDRMPRPVRLGSLVRWSRAIIEHWIDEGCPACEHARRLP